MSDRLDWDAYCALPRMNASTLVHGCKSMKHLRAAMAGGFPEESDAMRLGTGIHTLLLEPEEFEARYVVMPDFENDTENMRAAKRKGESDKDRQTNSRNTKYYKAKAAAFHQANVGRTVLKRDQYDQALHCIEAIRSRSYMSKIIDSSEKEVTLLGEIAGIPFKGRVDLLRRKRPLIVDLKTTGDCNKHAFGRIFARLHYDMKLAIYRELAQQELGKTPDVGIITQETSGVFDNAYVPVPHIVLDNAWPRVESVLMDFHKANKTGDWPGADRGKDRYELAVPQWAMEDADEELDWSTVPTEAPSDYEVAF